MHNRKRAFFNKVHTEEFIHAQKLDSRNLFSLLRFGLVCIKSTFQYIYSIYISVPGEQNTSVCVCYPVAAGILIPWHL